MKKYNLINFYFLCIFFLLAFILNYNNYVGNKILFFVFNLFSLGFFLTLLRKTISAFEFFLGFFFLLSFWFKFSCILYFESVNVTEGDFSLLISNYDHSIIIIIFTFLAFIIGIFLREKIFDIAFKENNPKMNNDFIILYKKFRYVILFTIISILILFWSTNFYFKIYSKGIINTNLPILIRYFYSWIFVYGLSVLVSIIIFLDYSIYKNKVLFFLGFFETFFTNLTILSRSFVLFFLAYSRGFLSIIKNKKNFIFNNFFLKIFFSIIIIFFSIKFVSDSRNIFFYDNKDQKNITIQETFSEIVSLAINRWVGIDALLSVSQNKKNSFELIKSALKEKKEISNKSFYIQNFFKKFEYNKLNNEKLNVVITPGIVAFLYYSGSIIFVFFSIIAIIILFSLIEKIFFLLSGNNFILSNIIGFSLANRIAHFGYVPFNTLYFILSFIITLLLVFFLNKIIWSK
jgi:hypothetical protein